MNYALIENGIVANIISLSPSNASDFPSAVALEDRPVGIGDSYADGVFTRDGMPMLTPMEAIQADLVNMAERVIDLELENALLEMGVHWDAL